MIRTRGGSLLRMVERRDPQFPLCPIRTDEFGLRQDVSRQAILYEALPR